MVGPIKATEQPKQGMDPSVLRWVLPLGPPAHPPTCGSGQPRHSALAPQASAALSDSCACGLEAQ